MKTKKTLAIILALVLLFATVVPIARAATEYDHSQEYQFILKAEKSGGSPESAVTINVGETIEVYFTLTRTGASGTYSLSAMQDEIEFDATKFQLVGTPTMTAGTTAQGFHYNIRTEAALGDKNRVIMDYSAIGDFTVPATLAVGHFTLQAIATGSTTITNEWPEVSRQDGTKSLIFDTVTQSVNVVITSGAATEHNITVTNPTGGTITPKVGGSATVKAAAGTRVDLSIAAAGREVIAWTVTSEGSPLPVANSTLATGAYFTMPSGAVTVTATLGYAITITNPTGGTITTSPSAKAAAGGRIDLSITAAGYTFNNWTVTRTSGGAAVTVTNATSDTGAYFTMPEGNVTVTASLTAAPTEYTITITNPTGGTITTTPSATATAGTRVNLNITASDYTFNRWTVTRTSGGAAVTVTNATSDTGAYFTMPAANVTVTASITAGSKITVANPKGGTITSPITGTNVASGTRVDLAITLDSGYTLDSWVVTSGGSTVTVVNADSATGAYFTMPSGPVTITATVTRTGAPANEGIIGEPEALIDSLLSHRQRFTDVPTTYWAYPYIEDLAQFGLVTGKTTTKYYPDDVLTRAECVAIIARMSGEYIPSTYRGPFTDVPNSQYYAGAVQWGVDTGVVLGTSPTTFSPNQLIKRQELAAMIVRYVEYKGRTFGVVNSEVTFTDSAGISTYARPFVKILQLANFINGYPDGSYHPAGSTTRAEAGKILALIFYAMNK
ncbi:MAG: S-layer homology domain-containing protein [Oscillospiraceae bacterium]|jgi:hypothetical protein|nr:S-layer homology domain-containing protein [Oscillospiraceae bacterium]